MRFSIVIPVFNTERHLSRCLDSLVAQTDGDFEAIVVDDGSVGTAEGIVARYDARFKCIRHAQNRSAFQARWTAILASRGDCIVPVDPDDYLLPETLAKLQEAFARDAPDMVAYRLSLEEKGKVSPHWCRRAAGVATGFEALGELAGGRMFTGVAGKAFRRETLLAAVRTLDAPKTLYVNTADDFLMLVPALLKSARVSFLDFTGYRYCINGKSTTFSWRTRQGYESAFGQMRVANDLIRRAAARSEVPADAHARVEAAIAGLEDWFARSHRVSACISRESSEKIAFWSFVCSLAVVSIHCGWRAEGALGRLSIALFKDTLARVAVPFFFACSGFFLAAHLGTADEWRHEIRKRLFSLGVPYLLWTLAVVAVGYLELGVWMGFGAIGLDPTRMPFLTPLWYLRCLLLFVVLAPLFKRALDRFRFGPIVVAYAALLGYFAFVRLLNLSVEGGLGGFLNFGFSVEGFFYFLCGMFLRMVPARRLSRKACFVALASAALLTLARLGLVSAGSPLWVDLRCLITPLTLVGLWGCFTPPALPAFLRGCAYPIYLMHGVVLYALRGWDGTYRLACNSWLEFGLCIVVPILFCNIVRRLCPRAADWLFGGRCGA